MTPDSQLISMVLGGDLYVILLVVPQERPGNQCVSLGQRAGRPVPSPSSNERFEPPPPVIRLRVDPAARGSRTVDQQCTQIAIAAFADPEEPWRASGRVFPSDQSQPGGQLAAVCELNHVTDRGEMRGGTRRSDPRDGLQPLLFRMGLTTHGQLLVVIRQAFVHGEKLVVEVPAELCPQRGQFRLVILQLLHEHCTKLGEALRQHNTLFAEESTALIHQRGTGLDEPLPVRGRAWRSCCSTRLMGTKCTVGRVTASQILRPF
jgi:hypothetical protein